MINLLLREKDVLLFTFWLVPTLLSHQPGPPCIRILLEPPCILYPTLPGALSIQQDIHQTQPVSTRHSKGFITSFYVFFYSETHKTRD